LRIGEIGTTSTISRGDKVSLFSPLFTKLVYSSGDKFSVVEMCRDWVIAPFAELQNLSLLLKLEKPLEGVGRLKGEHFQVTKE
jgi:hypothetical protein